ncbi:MAG: chloride channel protein [Bradyrhizobium sp.]|nr:chloride channel protein [Bradyrhizobium sp.]MDU6489934.1 chloride channel protein [Bradyrhizobium sp.]
MLSTLSHIIDRKASNRVVTRLRALLRSNEFYLIPLALVIGVATGAIVTVMSLIAQVAHVLIYGIPIDVRLSANAWVNPIIALIAPACGGLILGVMEWLRRRWKIAAAVDPVEANALRGGRLSMRDSIVVSSQTLVSNGSGASVGLEAGYTQIGAGVASLAGALTSQYLTGAPYSLEIQKVGAVGFEQYIALFVLALLVAGIGIVVMRASPAVERLFVRIPVWLRPAIGGVCVGAMAIVTPQVLAAGHGAMLLDLHREMAVGMIATIIVLKLAACLISLASGFRGGLFFASLFIGSLLGKLFAGLLAMVGLGVALDPLVAMLTGMATLGVAIVGGPLTMSFLVLEMTRSVDVTAVVLAACIVTSVCVRVLFGHSFSTWRLHLRGETIRSANDVGWLRNLTVERLMRSDVGKVPTTTSIAACRREFALGTRQAVVVVNNSDDYCGLVSLPDLFSGELDSIADDIQVVELAKYFDVALLPEMNVKTAMKIFDDSGAEVLAVLESENSRKVIGFLTESFARRRYVEEIDQATRGVLGALS